MTEEMTVVPIDVDKLDLRSEIRVKNISKVKRNVKIRIPFLCLT